MGISKGKFQEKIVLTSVTVSKGLTSACLREHFFFLNRDCGDYNLQLVFTVDKISIFGHAPVIQPVGGDHSYDCWGLAETKYISVLRTLKPGQISMVT